MRGNNGGNNIDLRTANGSTELETRILCRLSGQVRDLHVVVTDAGVILRGNAASYYAKQLAQHVVMKATPLPILANEIEVS
jgi:hypothetical protein